MSVRSGQLGSFAGYALHRTMPAPAPCFESWLASTADTPGTLYVLTAMTAETASDVEHALAYREAAARAARLTHDGIVPVREIGMHDERPFVVYEYLAGADATMVIARRAAAPQSVPVSVAATLVHGVVQVLRAVHEQGHGHGRLRPEQVIVDAGGDVSVTGFAEGNYLAEYATASMRDRLDAPEMRRDDSPDRDASNLGALDCYAVGALCYRLLTGREQPDEWEPRWGGLMMELSACGVPGDALRRTQDFLHRSLAERPAQRFATFGKLARGFGPVALELDAPKPRMVVAQTVRELMPPIVSIEPRSQPALHIDDDEIEALARDAAHDDPEEDAPAEVDAPRSSRTLDGSTRITGVGGRAPSVSIEPITGGGPRSTRILGQSSPGLRSLAPALRKQIGPHPLEILARSRYQVLGELGSGGTGTVYKILDTTLSEILALKVLRTDLTSDAAWLQRFKRELKITRDLEHAHILPAYHLEQLDGLYFFTMRYVDGETLYDTVRTGGALSVDHGLPILTSIGEALGAAHERGIVHRDFKSANVMIERVTGHPFLMDFGIALAPDNPGLTITGQGIGTPMYMAPEQAMGEAIGQRADIYSFGVVLYEAFSGRLPFHGTTTVAVYTAQVKSNYEPLPEIAPGLPDALCELVTRCLQPHPGDRPETMAEVIGVLRALG